MKKTDKVVLCCSVFLSTSLFVIITWVLKTFDGVNLDQIIFHLKVPLEGTNEGVFLDFLWYCIPLIFMISIMLLSLLLIKTKRNIFVEVDILHKKICLINLYPFAWLKRHSKLSSILFIILAIGINLSRIGAYTYFMQQIDESFFIAENYVDPEHVTLEFPEKEKNLIYIYMESMEDTFMSKVEGGGENVDLIPELTSLSKENTKFSNGNGLSGGAFQMPGTNWTIAGMVAESGGIPLKIPVGSNEYKGNVNFLPGAYTLGDILNEHGYKQAIMFGSDAKFAGRDLFYSQHGNYEIYDYKTALKKGDIPSGYKEWWGFEDKKLYKFAKEKLTELSKQEKPFNFTMLTADTHAEDGYLDKECEVKWSEQYPNTISCASNQVSDFIKWIQQQSFYEDTVIVISGDHISMDTKYPKRLDASYERTIMYLIINSDVDYEKIQRVYTSFDMYPTTLAALGVEIEGNRLGLGTNLYSKEQTLIEKYSKDVLSEEIQKLSSLYNEKNFRLLKEL